MLNLNPQQFRYQSCYCEENIWHLCQEKPFTGSQVVFISSLGDGFPVLAQKSAEHPGAPVYWDYHVILLVPGEEASVFDFDTTLGFGVSADLYFRDSFMDENLLQPDWRPLFRVITASDYVSSLVSDRSHMRDGSGWLFPPPDWPLIGGSGSNLHQFTDMNDPTFGEVLNYHGMQTRIASGAD